LRLVSGGAARMETQQILGNRYELLRRIGVGGMAAVFLAHDSRLDRDVAVKVLDMAGVTDHTFVERFRREARAAAAINHPNVVSVYDWGETGDPVNLATSVYYLVMEYVPGPNLKEKIQREGPLPEHEALRIGAQIAAALEAAHARGLIHRDIKSQNVLIDPAGNAKVADFGIAYLEGLTHLTQTNAVSGSAHYISPEQAQGKRVDARTDIYSLGIVLYEMLTGRVPFDGESLIDVALHHVQDEPIPLSRLRPHISTATETAVATALAKDPADRFARVSDFRATLVQARETRAAQTAATERRPTPGVVVERVPRAASRAQVTPDIAGRSNTVKLGAGVPGRRPRVRQEEQRPRWWILAVPVLLLVLVGGALAVHALSSGGRAASPIRTPSRSSGNSVRPTAHSVRTAASTPPGTRGTVMPTVSRPTAPPPTRPPASTPTTLPSTVVPTTAPALVPPGRVAASPPTAHAKVVHAHKPDEAVQKFYDFVNHQRYDEAASLWSGTMKAQYPPSVYIDGRFAGTQEIHVHITNVSQGDGTATVTVTLDERKTDGTEAGYVGSWHLIQSQSGWLLDSVDLTPTQVSNGGHGKNG
jgi:serine/threonine protein kinase